jgi:hypothetical protein
VTPRVSRAGKHVAAAVVIAMLSMTALVFVAPAASAADTTKFCAAVAKLQTKLDNLNASNGKNFNSSQYKGAGSAFKTAAKSAPTKVKKAMNTIGSFLSSLGGGNAVDAGKALASTNGKSYSKAIVTYSTYTATNCTGS